MMPAGMIQMVFSGEAGVVNALHDHVLAKMPRGQHGAVKYQTRLKENSDGVTARMNIEVPPEFFDDLLGKEWRAASTSFDCRPNGGNHDGAAENRYRIDYRDSR